jgi:hypothetical protein
MINLAKVQASPEYMALRERLVKAPATSSWLDPLRMVGPWLSWWRFLRWCVGLPGTNEQPGVETTMMVQGTVLERGGALSYYYYY